MKIDWIEPGKLAASGIPLGMRDIEALHDQGMRAVVSLTEHPLTVQRDVLPDAFTRFDLVYLHSPIKDQYAPDIAQAEAIIRHINQMNDQNRPVLVHCYAGSGRTGTILHAYYLAHGLNLDEAKAQVRSRRFACDFVILSDVQQVFIEQFAKRR